MLTTKVMDVVRKEHTTPFHKHLAICGPTLGANFLWKIQLHYDFNPKLEMFTEKLQMLVSSNVSNEQKVN
jgi:hypothetical protein